MRLPLTTGIRGSIASKSSDWGSEPPASRWRQHSVSTSSLQWSWWFLSGTQVSEFSSKAFYHRHIHSIPSKPETRLPEVTHHRQRWGSNLFWEHQHLSGDSDNMPVCVFCDGGGCILHLCKLGKWWYNQTIDSIFVKLILILVPSMDKNSSGSESGENEKIKKLKRWNGSLLLYISKLALEKSMIRCTIYSWLLSPFRKESISCSLSTVCE